ncbi:hypothetical protein [Ureibacillus sp. GCM10028918]|uniref:hypothetical protein n=1 Tax=Ureibacillus sp. GCM10028918 TaxID=3273429 RepID=UPI0036091E09
MSKSLTFIITLFLSITLLAACSTAEESTETDSETGTAHTEGKEVNESVDTDEPSTDEGQNEEPSTEDGQKEEPSTDETNSSSSITFSSKGESKTEELTAVSSEQYSIQVIPGFSLTPEEPGKEVLSYDEDDSNNMRIEALTINDTSFEDLVVNTEETMTAISKDYEEYDISAFIENYDLSNATAYIANLGSEEVIAVVFEKADKIVRLTIFDHENVDLSEAMIKMGLTIE